MSGVTLLLVQAAPPALAHTHPTPTQLTAPAVVQVRTDAVVDISLIEHNRGGAHIGLQQEQYRVPLMTSSGFAVDPTGSIVTSGRILDVGFDRAVVYAVNRIFQAQYGARAPLPADPYTRTRIVDTDPDDLLDPRLQRCYTPNTTDPSGGCLVTVSREVRVLPFVTDQKRNGEIAADVVYPQGAARSDVAVLRIGASSMPAVRLADQLDGTAYATLGFLRTPFDEASQLKVLGHFTTAGKPQVERDETYAEQVAALRRGLQGGPVVGDKGKVLGFLHVDGGPAAARSTITLVGPERINAVLKQAGVVPRTGPTDTAYEAASHNYLNQHYSAAIPDLDTTRKLYPGHALASQFLAISQAKAGTPEDISGGFSEGAAPSGTSSDDTLSRPVQAGLAGAALILLVLAVLLLRRRSHRGGPAGAPEHDPDTAPPPATVVPRPAASAAHAGPRPPSPRQPEGPVTVGSDARGPRPAPPPAPGTARARAGTAPGDLSGAWGRAAVGGAGSRPADTTGSGPFPRAVPAAGSSAYAAPRDVPCKVCGSLTSAELEYCETCGYPCE